MEDIYIPQLLKAKAKTEQIRFEEFISGLETLTPIRGIMSVRHGGNFLEVAVQAEAIVTLTCDRCLQQYNHRLSLEIAELIWLQENLESADNFPLEREITLDDLSETLEPKGYFHPDTWLYEQLSLAIPMQRLCGKNCQAPKPIKSIDPSVNDKRWSSLEALKSQLKYLDLEKD